MLILDHQAFGIMDAKQYPNVLADPGFGAKIGEI